MPCLNKAHDAKKAVVISTGSRVKGLPQIGLDLNKKTVLQRVGQNGEIVGPTLFLLTDRASFVTGHSLVVDLHY